jgi:hypothetical protein
MNFSEESTSRGKKRRGADREDADGREEIPSKDLYEHSDGDEL